MKKLLLSLVSGLFLLNAQAQVPFPMDGAIWVNTQYTYTFNPPNPIPDQTMNDVDTYCTTGQDTTIQGNDYTKVFYCGDAYKGALREVNSVVYFVPADSSDEYLLYDFTAQVGQTLQNVYVGNHFDESIYLQDFTVQQVGTEIIGGVSRRVVWADQFRWIEGIGCETGLFMEPWANVSMYANFLECMSVNDQRLFPTEGNEACPLTVDVANAARSSSSWSAYPNPTEGALTLRSDRVVEQLEVVILNALGQEMNRQTILNSSIVEIELPSSAGFYVVQLRTKRQNFESFRVLKQ